MAAAAAAYGYNNNSAVDLTSPLGGFQHRNSLSIADLRLKAKRHADELDAGSTTAIAVPSSTADN